MEGSRTGGAGRPLVFRDRVRSRSLVSLTAGLLLFGAMFASGIDAMTDRLGVLAAFGMLAVVSARASRLGVEARKHGIKLRGYFRNRSIAWSEISHFGREKMPGRSISVPVVVLQSGRRFVMHGLDSVSPRSPMSSPGTEWPTG